LSLAPISLGRPWGGMRGASQGGFHHALEALIAERGCGKGA